MSFQFLFQNHTKHYHLYYVAVAFKTLLPWHTVKNNNTLYITTQVIYSPSFLSPFLQQAGTDHLLYTKCYSKQNTVVNKEGGKQKFLPSEILSTDGIYNKHHKTHTQTHRNKIQGTKPPITTFCHSNEVDKVCSLPILQMECHVKRDKAN